MATDGQLGRWIDELAHLEGDAQRAELLARRPSLRNRTALERLSQEVLKALRQDRELAERLARASRWLADELDDDFGRALAAKSLANLAYVAGRYDGALEHYRAATRLFQAQGAEVDAAITLSSSIHALILVGSYEAAFTAAVAAREIFEQHKEPLLLARLDSNEAQIFMRQGQLGEALQRFERVLAAFRTDGEPQDVAAALYNIAVCRIGLTELPAALAAYEELSDHCQQHEMWPVAAQADYNIAYLYFLRGQYIRALELYRKTRHQLADLADPYHSSLCDLDQAEIYLELNLTADGAHFADRALTAFEKLGNGYEAAKAMTFRAIAAGRQGVVQQALELFAQAHELFRQEGNRIWPATIDLYRALILEQQGDFSSARQSADRAMARFRRFGQAGKAVLCQLLLARLELAQDKPRAAREFCLSALAQLQAIEVPATTCRAYHLLGQVEEALGNRLAALATFRQAHEALEDLHSHLRGEELKIAFLEDKYEIYESLIWMTLADAPSADDQAAALLYMEQAKSRSLADLVAFRADALPAARHSHQALVDELRQRREELNWTYRQINLCESKLARQAEPTGRRDATAPRQTETPTAVSASDLPHLRQRCREQEERVLRLLAEIRSGDLELGSLQAAGSLDLETLRAALPQATLLLEYFAARGTFFVAVLGADRLTVQPLGKVDAVLSHQQLLHFQLAKFQLTPDYLEVFGARIYHDALAHLGELYDALVAPIEEHLEADRLIIVPHGALHYLPFHAFWDGDRFLIDRFTLSYAPSASVLAMCCAKPEASSSGALVLGVPDELTPKIRDEVEAVAASLPDSELFVGEAATEARLRDHGPSSRLVHIATHGFFRLDNPMFSAIQLGTSRLTLFDLYQLELEAELVVLSGCATGTHAVESGDELIGLTRGLLYAGARSALVSLWDVNDASTAEFMTLLYRRLATTDDRAEAVRQAMLELRQSHPQPYHWAPFVLIGKPCAGC
ncbi:MAG: CHAT domain-containing protein [Acidobacteriota bacterium]